MICTDEIDSSQKMDMICARILASKQDRALIKGSSSRDV